MEIFPIEVVLTTHSEDSNYDIDDIVVFEEVLCERCQINPEHSLTGEEVTEGECRKCGRTF